MALQNSDSFSRATAFPTPATTMTRSFTVSAGASFLVVAVSANKFDMLAITGITYGGTALTQGATSSTSGVQPAGRIWYLAAPTVGTANIVVTTSANSNAGAYLIAAFDGLNSGGTPSGAGTESASANTISPTVTVGSTATAVIVGSAYDGGTASGGSGTTTIATGLNDGNGANGKGSFGYRDAAQPALNFSLTNQLGAATLVLPGSGDTTPPTLTSPSGTGGTAVCSGSVSTNEGNGTLYTVATASATAPTAAQVKLGQDHTGSAALRVVSQAVSASGTQTIASGAVSAGTRYLHFMHEDAATNQSTVASSASFTVTAGGDTTAPVLTSPVGTATGATTATAGATTDEGNGTLYAVVTASATQPSVAQIKAGQNDAGTAAAWSGTLAISSTGAKTLGATGLTAAATYYAHLVHTDAAGNNSNRVSSSSFTTTAVPGFDLSSAAYAFKDNTGALVASTALTFTVHNNTTGALVAQITGYSTNASGIVTSKVTNASLVAATTYSINVDGPSGTAFGRFKMAAA